jgi:hypothetical protein
MSASGSIALAMPEEVRRSITQRLICARVGVLAVVSQ